MRSSRGKMLLMEKKFLTGQTLITLITHFRAKLYKFFSTLGYRFTQTKLNCLQRKPIPVHLVEPLGRARRMSMDQYDAPTSPASSLTTTPPPRCAGSRGRCTGWSGWTLPRAVTWFVTHPQNCSNGPAASQATGNHLIWGCSRFASRDREDFIIVTSSRTTLEALSSRLDLEDSFSYLEGKC